MIAELLTIGKENARTAKELATALNCATRDISDRIEKERRRGAPIIASCDPKRPGYYLAETPEELQLYCARLHHRAGEIHKTRRALLDTLQKADA